MFRNPGSFTSGEREAVRLDGPRTPATYLGASGSRASYSSATDRASAAPVWLSSYTRCARP